MTWIFLSPAPVRTTSTVEDSSSAAASPPPPPASGDRDGRGGADAELLLERLDALGELEHGDALELLDPICGAGSHVFTPRLLRWWSSSSERLGGLLGGLRRSGRLVVWCLLRALRRPEPRRRVPPRPEPRRRCLLGRRRGVPRRRQPQARRRPGSRRYSFFSSTPASAMARPPMSALRVAGQAGDRRGDQPDELPVEHLARRQLGDARGSASASSGVAVHEAALEGAAGRSVLLEVGDAPWPPPRRRRGRTSARSGPRAAPSAPRRSAASAARSVSVFLTTRNVASALTQLARAARRPGRR